jgi:hypothetical protein
LLPEYLEDRKQDGGVFTTSAESEKALRLDSAESWGLIAKHDDAALCRDGSARVMHPANKDRRSELTVDEDGFIPSCCFSMRSYVFPLSFVCEPTSSSLSVE